MNELLRAGKVRQIGCTYLTGAEFEEACAAAAKAKLSPFTTCQNEYSLLVRGIERDLVPAMARHGVGFLPYLPLAGGLLTGKYRRDVPFPAGARLSTGGWPGGRVLTERNWRIVEKLLPFCAARGRTHARSRDELARGASRSSPASSPARPGPSRSRPISPRLSWTLSPEDLAEVDRLTLTP